MEKLKVESADVRVSNSNEADRTYNISGTAHVANGAVTYVNNGQIYDVNNGSMLADFESSNASHLRVIFQNADGRSDTLSAIEAFITKCRTSDELEISISE